MAGRALGLFLAAMLFFGAVARAAPPPVEDYGKLPAIDHVSLSPSGERIAYVAKDGEDRRLIVATLDGKPIAGGNIGGVKVRDVVWAGDDHVLVVSTATVTLGPNFTVWQTEMATVVVIDVSTGKMFQVFGKAHELKVLNAVQGFYGAARVDGRWYGWFGTTSCETDKTGCYKYQDHRDLYRVDLDTGDIAIAARGRRGSRDWLVGPTGEVIARSYYDERDGAWEVLAGRDDDRVLAAGQNELGETGRLHLGRSADRILVDLPTGDKTSDRDGGYLYREIPLSGGPEQPVPNAETMLGALFDSTSHLMIGEIQRDDEREPLLFSAPLEARWRGARKAFPNNLVHLVSWSGDFSRLIVFTEGGDDSGAYWLVDIAKHSADPVGGAYPSITAADVGPVRMVDWKAADGLPLHGVLTLPPGRGARSLPLVVLPHGGPASRDYPGFDWWAQAFASRGYAVFQPNFRGSGGYGVEFRNAGFGEWGRKMETDISDGVADLARQGIVDPKRACIVGGSYGGYAALAGVTVQQGLYRCAVSVAGVSDLVDMLNFAYKREGQQNAELRYWRAFMGVTSIWERTQLKPITPSELADRADAPILLIHGRDDTVVPIAQSETMESALKSAGKPVEMVVMKNEDHWLSREATRIEMLKAAVAFVEKNNPAN
jgi:dipeptidyl aminopeptidase/acylaminoacyl peptidase